MNSKPNIYTLHGFLGLPSDFDFLDIPHFSCAVKPAPSFESWAQSFNDSITTTHNILIGYSMGARLALQAWKANPKLWNDIILISGHPGLTEGHEERLNADKLWAERFLKDDWDLLMKDWEGQAALKSYSITRYEKNYKREELASHLLHFSLGKQPLFDAPALWILGGEDPKKIKQRLPNPIVIENKGHRLPWECPNELNHIIKKRVEIHGSTYKTTQS